MLTADGKEFIEKLGRDNKAMTYHPRGCMVRIVKKPDERREEILQAGCRLFLAKGYENTTMRDVMRELDIAKGTIYHYFKSKEELLDAVSAYIAGQEAVAHHQILEQTTGNAIERMEQLVL